MSETTVNKSQKYTIPKTAVKLDPNLYDSLSASEKLEYEQGMRRPKKAGYAIIHKRYNVFYKINFFDFLPLYIGSFYAFVRFCIGYGDFKNESNFDKKMSWDARNVCIIGCIYMFFVTPLIHLVIFFIAPFIILGADQTLEGWNNSFTALTNNDGVGRAILEFSNNVIIPLFSASKIIITLPVWIIISCFNTKTFIFKFLLRSKRNEVFIEQKRVVKEAIIKINVSKKN